MLRLLKNLIGGIFSFLLGLIPGVRKSRSGYFMELPETAVPSPPVPVVAAPTVPPEPEPPKVAPPAAAPASPAVPVAPFAPTYLNPANNQTGARRFPGPSMSSFLDMARQVQRS